VAHPFTVSIHAQGTEGWLADRAGYLTGSVAGDILATVKSGEAAARRNLRLKLVLERILGRSMESGFVSDAMAVGTAREPLARVAYEAETGNLVEQCGFLRSTLWPFVGASIDGQIDGFTRLLSIKCRQPAAHLDFLRSGVIPPDAMAQIRHELWVVPQAEAMDYYCWNPDFPAGLQSRLVTVTREQADIPGYESAAMKFLAEVEIEYQAITTMADSVKVLA